MVEDRRFYHRYPLEVEIVGVNESGFTVKGELQDISIEGAKLKFYGKYPFNVGDLLTLVTKGKINLKLKGKIVWKSEAGGLTFIGIRFEKLDFETNQKLSQILSEFALSMLTDIGVK